MFSFSDGKSLQGREKADYLVNQMGKQMHVRDAHLDDNNDRSFGEMGFHYDTVKNVLTGRVFIAKAYLEDEPPEIIEGFRSTARALNDPTMGGMFEGGGHFILDEKEEIFFLTKQFPVDSTTPQVLWNQMEDLSDLGARWVFKWFRHVARMSHGKEAPPTHFINRQNDPYPRN